MPLVWEVELANNVRYLVQLVSRLNENIERLNRNIERLIAEFKRYNDIFEDALDEVERRAVEHILKELKGGGIEG